MRKTIERLWDLTNDLEDYCRYGHVSGKREKYMPLSFAHGGATLAGAVSPAPVDSTAAPDSLSAIAHEVSLCRKCRLCEKRNRVVPGAGSSSPDVMIIGEGPGAEEDAAGIPFVGAAGRYLDKWLAAISLDRGKDCFIGNIVKCRPPGNRDPQPDEMEACLPYLERQISLLKPLTILTLGRISGRIITGKDSGIGKLRGNVYSYRGIPVVATYHPSAVLRDRGYRPAVWEDLKLLREVIDRNKNVR